jgi:ribosomal-protein-alanine N-acetyltransferase
VYAYTLFLDVSGTNSRFSSARNVPRVFGQASVIRYHACMMSHALSTPLADRAESRPAARVIVERAAWRDLPALARLQRRAFPPPLAYTLPTLVILRMIPWVRTLLVRQGEQIAGCVIGDRVLEGGRVVNLAVDPAYRRQRIGYALLAAIEQELNTPVMMLMVQQENTAARQLYLRAGYTEELELPNYYGTGRVGIRMRKTLSEGGDASLRE